MRVTRRRAARRAPSAQGAPPSAIEGKFALLFAFAPDKAAPISQVVVRGKNGAAELRREPLELSALAAGRLRALVARAAVPFNSGDSDHRAALARLWTAAFPRDLPSEGGPSERWKDMGWQGKDPATDFRGGGVLGLDNLIGLHTHFPRTFAALLHKTRGSRAEIEYPFAVAGVNISFQLMTMLGLRDPALVAALTEGADNGSGTGVDNGGAQPAEPGGAVVPAHAAPEELHAFAEALSVPGPHGARALDSLYAFTFEALDSKWLLSQDVMEFNATLAQAVAVTNAALVARDDHSLRFTDIVS